MDKTPLLIAGPLISALGIYLRYRKKSIGGWMNSRRIDTVERQEVCRDCGAELVMKTAHSGPRKGMKAAVCRNYPECKYIEWRN